jgi:hypothetical protein
MKIKWVKLGSLVWHHYQLQQIFFLLSVPHLQINLNFIISGLILTQKEQVSGQENVVLTLLQALVNLKYSFRKQLSRWNHVHENSS